MRILAVVACAALVASSAWAQDDAKPQAAPVADAAPVEAAPSAAAAGAPELSAEQQEYLRQATALYESLNRQTGIITIAEGKVSMLIFFTIVPIALIYRLLRRYEMSLL